MTSIPTHIQERGERFVGNVISVALLGSPYILFTVVIAAMHAVLIAGPIGSNKV
jgi:hypothetical protein